MMVMMALVVMLMMTSKLINYMKMVEMDGLIGKIGCWSHVIVIMMVVAMMMTSKFINCAISNDLNEQCHRWSFLR